MNTEFNDSSYIKFKNHMIIPLSLIAERMNSQIINDCIKCFDYNDDFILDIKSISEDGTIIENKYPKWPLSKPEDYHNLQKIRNRILKERKNKNED